jgi:threonine dehydratase
VDGVACRLPDADALAVIRAGAARIVQVSEAAAAEAMRVLLSCTHNVPEPAGALAFAGALAERAQLVDRRVAVIHTGGNVDASMLAVVLAGGTPT